VRKQKRIKPAEAGGHFKEVLEQVSRDKTRVLIEKSGETLAAIVPEHDLRRLQALDAEEDALLARMRAAFCDLTEEQIDEEVARALEAVRVERRGSNPAQADR